MGAPVSKFEADPFACNHTHPLTTHPYRMIVFSGFDGQGTPVYWVAGGTEARTNAKNALKRAMAIHGGSCFYCRGSEQDELTIDHETPRARGGSDDLPNLLVSCRSCNAAKGARSMAEFNVGAASRWRSSQVGQHQRELARLTGEART